MYKKEIIPVLSYLRLRSKLHGIFAFSLFLLNPFYLRNTQ